MISHSRHVAVFSFFFFNDTATPEISTLPLHDALPICPRVAGRREHPGTAPAGPLTRLGPPRHRPGGVPHAEGRGRYGARSTGSPPPRPRPLASERSEEHTSELQSRSDLVCRLLLEKKK